MALHLGARDCALLLARFLLQDFKLHFFVVNRLSGLFSLSLSFDLENEL